MVTEKFNVLNNSGIYLIYLIYSDKMQIKINKRFNITNKKYEVNSDDFAH